MKPLSLLTFVLLQAVCGLGLLVGFELRDDGINVGWLHLAFTGFLPFVAYLLGMAQMVFQLD